MITLDHCVYLLLLGRLEKERARGRAKSKRQRERGGEKHLQKRREWAKNNPEKISASNQKHYAANRECLGATKKKYYEDNREKCIGIAKNWQKRNPERAAARQKEMRRRDIGYRIRWNLRSRISCAIRGVAKSGKTQELLGCSINHLLGHLEKQFMPGMAWTNYGKWHVDHRRPCASFDLTQPEQQKFCFHYSNLQPLWAADNIRKSDTWHT